MQARGLGVAAIPALDLAPNLCAPVSGIGPRLVGRMDDPTASVDGADGFGAA